MLCSGNGYFPEQHHPSRRRWRRRARPADGSRQHDAGRIAEHIAEADAAARAAAIRGDLRHHVHALDHGSLVSNPHGEEARSAVSNREARIAA